MCAGRVTTTARRWVEATPARAWRVGGIRDEGDTQLGCARFGVLFDSMGARGSDSRCNGAVRRGFCGRDLLMWCM